MKNLYHAAKKIIVLMLLMTFSFVVFAQQNDSINYPELSIARQYQNTVKVMVNDLLRKSKEDITDELRQKIFSYIFSGLPISNFEEMIIGQDDILREGHSNIELRETNDYTQTKNKCDHLSRRFAMMVVSNALDIYARKELKQDPMTGPLFANSNSKEDDQLISWIIKQIPHDEFLKEGKIEYDLIPSDRVFYYRSPDFSWEQLFGREGYFIYRQGKIVKSFITVMN